MNLSARSASGPVAALCGVLLLLLLIVPRALANDLGRVWTLAAVAPDVDAVVFRDPSGVLHTIAVGEHLPGDVWRLTAVRGGHAILVADQPRGGYRVERPIAIDGQIAPSLADEPGRSAGPRVVPTTETR
jgi:hypothetical protein